MVVQGHPLPVSVGSWWNLFNGIMEVAIPEPQDAGIDAAASPSREDELRFTFVALVEIDGFHRYCDHG